MKLLFRPIRPLITLLVVGAALVSAACSTPAPATLDEPEEQVVLVVTPTPDPNAAQPTAPPAEAPAEQPAEEPAAAEPTAAPPAGAEGPGLSADSRIASNAAWIPQEQDFEGITFKLVPTGCFRMGFDGGIPKESPQHEQCFDAPFWIMETEVTNLMYSSEGYYSGDNLPRTEVTWFEAKNFCESLGGRLPYEREWEYAARGPDSLTYPFGNNFTPGFVIHADNATSAIEVATYPENASWVGAIDMAGNVREWVTSAWEDYPWQLDSREDYTGSGNPDRVVRGGSHFSGREFLRSSYREFYDWNSSTADIGFRCVRDY